MMMHDAPLSALDRQVAAALARALVREMRASIASDEKPAQHAIVVEPAIGSVSVPTQRTAR